MVNDLDQQAGPNVVGPAPIPLSTSNISEADAISTGHGKRRSLPDALKEKIYSLGVAEEEIKSLTVCLKEGDCVQDIQALMHSSGEAVKVLTKRVCTYNYLADQVAVVHTDLDTVLLVCAVLEKERGLGNGLWARVFDTSKDADLESIDTLYCTSRATLIRAVVSSMEAVHGAAKAALQR
ncbi:g9393 [Coccomyxa elongata]